jgi:dihydrofolate reductase
VDRPAIAVGIREEAEAAPRVLLDIRHVDAAVAQEGADFVDVVDVDLDAFERVRRPMSKSVLYMWMSLDGFIAGPDDDVGQGLGRGGERLHDWLGDGDEPSGFRPSGPSGEIYDEAMATGAVLVGRRTFDLAGRWNGDHHGVPIFVPTRGEPPAPASDLVHYVTDGIESAMSQAKRAAGDANVLVHGANLAQSCLRAGVLDELEIGLVPVLLGEGRLLFEELGAEHTELEVTRVVDAPGVTYLHFRVKA